jgi:hypothetical protein
MEPLFYIGQAVVALKDNHQGFFKKGDEFKILDIFLPPCKCKGYVVQINNFIGDFNVMCTDCHTKFISTIVFFDQKEFAPIQEIGDMTFEEAIELVTKKEMV